MQSLPYLSFRWHHWKTKKPQSHKSETACENIGPWAPWKHTSIIQQFLKSGISKPSRLHCREFLEFQEGNLSLHCTHQKKKKELLIIYNHRMACIILHRSHIICNTTGSWIINQEICHLWVTLTFTEGKWLSDLFEITQIPTQTASTRNNNKKTE